MTGSQRFVRLGAATLVFATLGACAQTGGLGSILGGVLGGQQGSQVIGTVRSVDTRNAQIVIQQSNGQSVGVGYDNQTQVVYQNQNYTDYIQVDQSVSSNTGNTSNAQVQSLQGTVRRVDIVNGWFEVSPNNNVVLTVTMPYNLARSDLQRFQNLRNGDVVRFYGVYLNNSRVELRQFY